MSWNGEACLNSCVSDADAGAVSLSPDARKQRDLLDYINDHARTHPVPVVIADGLVGGSVGFVIGAIGSGDESLARGYAYAAPLGVFMTIVGLAVVFKARGAFQGSAGSHALNTSAWYRRSITSHWPAWAGRLRFSRIGRLAVGLSVGALALAVTPFAPHALAVGLTVMCGVFVASAKFRRFP